MSNKKEITISSVKDLLNQGYTRAKIKEHFQITDRDVKALFAHPKLAGLKAKKVYVPQIEIIDDEVSQDSANQNEDVPAEAEGQASPFQ